MEGFEINRIKLLLLTFLILTLSSGIGAAAEIRVSSGGSIQAAVNTANSGDTIIVDPGTYNENIVITKSSNLKLMSASGNPDDTIIVSNDTTKNVISASARLNLIIKGFTISGATSEHSGIYLYSCNGCTIENNKFINNAMGVYIDSSMNTTIRNNSATRTSEAGKIGRSINVLKSELTTVENNTISNQNYSIYFDRSPSNTILRNSVSQCAEDAIVIEGSNNTVLESNTVSSNTKRGIYLKNSHKCNVKKNLVSSNGANGIDIEGSSGNNVLDNIITGNAKNTNIHGLFLNTCKGVTLQNNTISNCQYGVAMRYSEDNSLVKNDAYNNSIGFYVSYTSRRNTLSDNKANSNNNGIIIERGANNNVVDKNEINSNSASGLALDNAISNEITNNSASLNNRGIYLLSLSSKNSISGNKINSNKNDGIILQNASENDLTSNTVNSNARYGIYLTNSNNSNLVSNTVQNNIRGISLSGSGHNEIFKNLATDCSESGLFLTNSTNNNLSRNIAYNNGEGISLDSSGNNEISANNVSSNGNGIYMCPRSYPNRVYNNYFNNINNANIRNNRSTWYIEKTPGKNIMSGPSLGGNFWGSPSLMGFSDTNSDADGDGIIDIPFVSANGNITDNYPLIRVILPVANFNVNSTKGFIPLAVEFTDLSQDATSISWDLDGDGVADNNNKKFVHVYETPGIYTVTLTASNKNDTSSKTVQITAEEFKILPIADFSINTTNGYAPLSVLFTDKSQNATSRNWDIGNDGTVESTDASFVYVFTNPGTYTVNLTSINVNGISSKITSITVTTEESSSSGGSSHHSSGGGGGGAGGSPEPQTNVQVKELSKAQVTNGKPVLFDFTKNATCVAYVSFDAKKTAGKITTIAEQLKVKSTLVSVLNSGEVYKYFNLWVGNSGFATEKNIENPVVCFKVEKSWLQDKKIDQSSITLNRYNDKKWSQLPVKLLKEDSKYLYFTAETPGFSFFAITGKAVEKVAEAKPSTDTSNLDQNSTTSETEPEQKTEQEPGKNKTTSIPGFEALYVVACLVMAFLHRRK